MAEDKKQFEILSPFWEAIKEPLRILVLAIIPFGLTSLTKLDYTWAIVMTLILRFVDSFLHQIGKVTVDENLTKGLVRF